MTRCRSCLSLLVFRKAFSEHMLSTGCALLQVTITRATSTNTKCLNRGYTGSGAF